MKLHGKACLFWIALALAALSWGACAFSSTFPVRNATLWLLGVEEPQNISEDLPLYLSEGEAVVTTFAQFKEVLLDAVTTTVYLGDMIAMESGGVQINQNKPYLIIDGNDPTKEEDTMHIWRDYASDSDAQTIRLRYSGTLKHLTLRNLQVEGSNHYGFVFVHNDAKGVYLLYDNVHYRGPQMTYNRFGTSHYRDVTAEIGRFGGASGPGEIGEVSEVLLDGTISFTQVDKQENEFFWFAEKAGDLTLLPGADVTVVTPWNAGFAHTSVRVNLELMEGARLVYKGKNRFWDGLPFRAVTLGEGAVLDVTIDQLVNSLLRVDGPLLVEEDATMRLEHRGSTVYPCLLMNGGSAEFHSPKRVVMINPDRRNLQYETSTNLSIGAAQVNYWTQAGPGDFSDPPVSRWWKTTGEDFTLDGTPGIGSEANWSSLESNYDPNDTAGSSAPSAQNFHMKSSRVLSFGALPLSAAWAGGAPGAVTGYTDPLSAVRATYVPQGEEASITAVGAADANGSFTLELQPAPTIGGEILVESNRDYLFAQTTVIAYQEKELMATIPQRLSFRSSPISHFPTLVDRQDPDWQITVTDSLDEGDDWTLSVRLLTSLSTTRNGRRIPLSGDIVFLDDGVDRVLSANRSTVIYRHTSTGVYHQVPIAWDADEGLLVRVEPGGALSNRTYEATLLWMLEMVP